MFTWTLKLIRLNPCVSDFYFFLILRYMGDFYELELQSVSGVRGWIIPETNGGGPSARESHTAVANTGLGSPKLYIFGGMQGSRLNDLWQLDLGMTVVKRYQKLSEGKSIKIVFFGFFFQTLWFGRLLKLEACLRFPEVFTLPLS